MQHQFDMQLKQMECQAMEQKENRIEDRKDQTYKNGSYATK